MDNCISFFDVSITRDHTGTLDTNIYQKPTHSKSYRNFKSENPLEHKSAVVNALTNKTNSLIRDKKKKRMELKHIQNILSLNCYPNWLMNQNYKSNQILKLAIPTICNAIEINSIAILPYVPKLSEKLKSILLSHGIRIVFKPSTSLVVY